MSRLFSNFNLEVAAILKNGGVGVIPTDTIYGICGPALNKNTVQKIYLLRKRNPKKPMIILIGSPGDLNLFGIKLDLKTRKILSKIWPNKISVILPCRNKKYLYLHRGTKTLAFRAPKKKKMLWLLKRTGPLVAPSANWEGFPSAENIRQAKKYFGDKIDFYVDRGTKKSEASTLIEIKNGKAKVLREGAAKL